MAASFKVRVDGVGSSSHIDQDKLVAAAVRIRGSQLVTIPVGHSIHAGRPRDFVRAVLTWIGE